MPLCECGKTHLTDLRSDGELGRWAHRQGDCWDYNERGRPFWFFCVPCHGRRWPNDRRWGNRHDSPAPPWLHTVQKGVRHYQCLAGDFFYLTTPPPERVSTDTRSVRPRLSVEPAALHVLPDVAVAVAVAVAAAAAAATTAAAVATAAAAAAATAAPSIS
jgi:hypothetical protein